jgi:hypothetical protein
VLSDESILRAHNIERPAQEHGAEYHGKNRRLTGTATAKIGRRSFTDINVRAIERSFVMSKIVGSRYIRQVRQILLDWPLGYWPVLERLAVRAVFNKCPNRNPVGRKPAPYRDDRFATNVATLPQPRYKSSHRIEGAAKFRLLTLVGADRADSPKIQET